MEGTRGLPMHSQNLVILCGIDLSVADFRHLIEWFHVSNAASAINLDSGRTAVYRSGYEVLFNCPIVVRK